MLVPKYKGINSEKLYNLQGGTNWSEGYVKFEQDVKHLLETPLGSMLGNISYGSNLYQLLFLPVSESTGTLIQEEIRRTIERNYPDIKVPNIDIEFDKNTVNAKIGIDNKNSNIIEYIDLNLERSSGE